MKKSIFFVGILALVFASCEKESNSASFPYTPELAENLVLKVEEDANQIVTFFTNTPSSICGDSDSTYDSATQTYQLTFNGANCDGDISRSGIISAQLITGSVWNEVGSQIKVTYTDYQVQFLSTGQSIVVNGEKTFSNLSGSQNINDLQIGSGEMKTSCAGTLNIQANGELYMNWNEAYSRTTRKIDVGVFRSSIKPEGTGLPYSNVIRWGTDNEGGEYYNTIEDSIQSQLCFGNWKRFDGKYTIYSTENAGATQIYLGYNSANAPIASNCESAKMKVLWVNDLGQTVESFRLIY